MKKSAVQELTTRMQELRDLVGVLGLLQWDQETYMPPKGGEARAQHLATVQGLYHERLTDPALGEALSAVEAQEDLTHAQQAAARILAWERSRAVKVPLRLVKEIAEQQSLSVEAWREARKERAFAIFLPHLEALVRLRREQASALGHEGGEPYDALLENFEPGMRAARLESLFRTLREELVPLVRAIADAGKPPDRILEGRRFDVDKQWDFTLRLLRDLGFDLEAGRQDRSTHPFTGGAGHPLDVRLTTRLYPDNPLSAVMGTIHEAGHGLYEQGFARNHYRTPVAQAPSMGLHESQSRFWENIVGRSLPFWRHYLPVLEGHFPSELAGVDLPRFYGIVNTVAVTPIRVEADEVTYNLHVLLRFELELSILRGDIQAAELPAAFNARMQDYLGMTPAHDSDGVMQDIHWAWGEFGYFPTYALGNLYSAMWLRAMEDELPGLWGAIGQGELGAALSWLREKIHRQGFLYSAEELARRVTGQGLSVAPFIAYLWEKYGPLYGVRRG